MSTMIEAPFPHVFRVTTAKQIYYKLCIAIAPVLLVGMWRGGAEAIMVFVVAVAAGAVTEFLIDLLRTNGVISPTRNGRILYLMMLISILLPADTDPIAVTIAAAASIVIGIHLMGGAGVYFVHPVFIGLLVIAGSTITTVPEVGAVSIDALANDVANSRLYQSITRLVFSPFGMRVPADAVALLVNIGDVGAVSIGAGLLPIVVLGSFVVFGEDLVPPILVLSFLVGVVVVFAIAEADIVDLLVRSNLVLVLFFAMADPSIRPLTRTGMVIQGVLSGIGGAILLVLGGVAVPVVTGVVLVAVLRPTIDLATRSR